MDDWPGDFAALDPLERFNAHQRAKGRVTFPDPDALRKRLLEGHDPKSEFYGDNPTAEVDDLWREQSPEKGCGA